MTMATSSIPELDLNAPADPHPPAKLTPDDALQAHTKKKDQLTTRKRLKRLAYGLNYISEEETIRNDYSLHYVHSGSRPQNHIQNPGLATRFAEYPKLKRLLELKQAVVATHAHPPTYLQVDLRSSHPNAFNLLDLHPSRFDVIVLDPPLQEYAQSHPDISSKPPHSTCGGPPDAERPWWTWEELEALPVPQIAASPGFIFLWCGTGQGKGLEQGRALLARWGYRKCEDLVWVKTNHDRAGSVGPERAPKTKTVFTPTKEHCLMGIRGTVRRSTDGHFVNCNVDTDVIVADADPNDPLHKPVELYNVIENFCLGHRRLELFGSKHSLRRGWLTIGNQCAPDEEEPLQAASEPLVPARPIPYVKQDYVAHFLDPSGRTQNLLPTIPEIESLRPRSPPGRMGTALAGPSGSPLPRGLGLGMSGQGSSPMGNHAGLMGAGMPVSGRNTISHPSGGLGRGPGNALLPGMRVSGFRDGGNNSVPGSANFKNMKQTGSPRGRDNRNMPGYGSGGQQMGYPSYGYPMSPQMQIHPGMMMAGSGNMPLMHPGNMVPHMMPNHQVQSQSQNWAMPHLMGNSYGCPPFSNPNPMVYGPMGGAMPAYPNNAEAHQTGFGSPFGGSHTPPGSSFNGQQAYNPTRNPSSIAYQHQQPYQATLNYPNPFHPHPQAFASAPPSFQSPNSFSGYSGQDQSTFQGPSQQQMMTGTQESSWGTGSSQQHGGPYQTT